MKHFLQKIIVILPVSFPGASFVLLILTRRAIRADAFKDYSESLLLLSCYTSYFLIYTLLRSWRIRISHVLATLFTAMSLLLVQLHLTTGRMMASNVLFQFSLEQMIAVFVDSNGGMLALLLPLILVIISLIRYASNRLIAPLQLQLTIRTRPMQIALGCALALQIYFLLFQPHLQQHSLYFFTSSIKPVLLARELETFDISAQSQSLHPFYQVEGHSYPRPDYPYYRLPTRNLALPGTKRHVFLIFMESLNALQLKAMEDANGPSTFSRIAFNGLRADRFYANSQDSHTGQLAVLCSTIPGILKHTILSTHFYCLPRILQENGYRTLHYSDVGSAFSYEASTSMQWLGFQERYGRLKAHPPGATPRYGWSMEGDAAYYRDVFEHLRSGWRNEPLFVTIANSENHFPYDQSENMLALIGRRAVWPALFQRSQARAIDALNVFFEELNRTPRLRDSLVIIVGDHSTPMLEHGNVMRDQGFYEENFRTIFTLYGLGARNIPFQASQIDVAPTLLDALGISSRTHFLGQSLLRPDAHQRPIFLTQYGEGRFYIVVDYPQKYVYRLSDGREQAFHLGADPHERRPFADGGPFELGRFRVMRDYFKLNQAIILQNRQVPPEMAAGPK